MKSLTSRERIANILKRRPVDRIGVYEHIWSSTLDKWRQEGFLKEKEHVNDHFGFDMVEFNPFNLAIDPLNTGTVTDETQDSIYISDGNGVKKRILKDKPHISESVGFNIKDREDWKAYAWDRLVFNDKRIKYESYKRIRDDALIKNRFFVCAGLNVFELIRSLCGYENMFLGIGLDKEWIMDMADIYSDLLIDLQEELFSKAGLPDAMWYSEDLGYKNTAFISVDTYREIFQTFHKKTFDYAHSKGLPVIMHSCGMVEKLLASLIESGIDCLQAIEVKAGMDILKLHREYGEKISFIGGIDVRALFEGKEAINSKLARIIPEVMKNYGYILHSDHSIPDNVEYENYKYFVEKGLALGTY